MPILLQISYFNPIMQDNTNIFDATFSETSKAHLLETTRWTKFLAILMFIFIGLMLLGVISLLSSGAAFSGMTQGFSAYGPVFSSTVFLFIILLYWYPTFMLYKFSTDIKAGLTGNNQELIESGFRCQKNMYKFMGILVITILVLYLILITVVLVSNR